jgi:hypothetical protein
VTAAPGWFDDPTGRYELRYWDGETWTDHVASGGAVARSSVPIDPAAFAAPTQLARAPGRTAARGSRGAWWLLVVAVTLVALPVVVAIAVAMSGTDSRSTIDPFADPGAACEAWWHANVAAARDGWDDARFSRELHRLADATAAVDPTLASLLRSIASDDAAEIRASIETAYQRCVGLHQWRGATDDEIAIVGRPSPPR